MTDVRSDKTNTWQVNVYTVDKHGNKEFKTTYFLAHTIFQALEKAEKHMADLAEEECLKFWTISNVNIVPEDIM